ncbi:MAG: hypothetical protein IPM82_22180 [Saprospiraceae bacterium]|nr:hypothetical protein [Saprospiraceae bacterium]
MNTFRTIIASFALLLSFQVSAQMENAIADLNFKLKLMDDQITWGVFVVPGESIAPTKRSNTGSGQVTIVAPVGFAYAGLDNVSGTWIENARVDGPMEAPDKAYISFGFVTDEPRIKYFAGKETLLFTFIPEDTTMGISLINNENDPFSTPNTYGSNPGNDLGVLDFGHSDGTMVYTYGTNLVTEGAAANAVFASQKTTEKNQQPEGAYKVIFASEKISTPNN